MTMHGLWRGKTALVLASKSAARQMLLESAGIPFESIASAIDERGVEAPLREQGATASKVAACLAKAKAAAVAAHHLDRLVVGADQTLSFESRIFSKPATIAEAHEQLMSFSGRRHELHSAICIMRGGSVLFEAVASATLTCRNFSSVFIDHYIGAVGEAVLSSVGAYQIEGLGIHLFEKIEGDHATILGLPLIPLLAFLRSEGSLIG